jgi:nucleoside-diphosphate-sugar epimerase
MEAHEKSQGDHEPLEKSNMSDKRVIITGATGMVGGCALRICLENPNISQVTVIGRSPTGINDAKLHEVLLNDFTDFTENADVLEGHDVALYCLGVYTGVVPDDIFRQITVEYTLAFAKALYEGSPQAAFCFLSGQGADQTEKSRMAFARYKGAAEKGLLAHSFPRIHIFRPGYIYPVTPRDEPNLVYQITRMLYPVIRRIYPNIGVPSEDLARVMVHAGIHGSKGYDNPILENKDIRSMEIYDHLF